MKNTCLRHPANEPLIVIRKWQLDLCNGNACAAALLSFFEYWHNVKLSSQQQAADYNRVAEQHGDTPAQYQGLLQWHTLEQIEDGVMLYKRDAIRKALSILEGMGFISIHTNPNPRYKFDKTKHFLFHPEIVQAAIDGHSSDLRKNVNRFTENRKSSSENQRRGSENQQRGSENQRRGSENQRYPKTTSEITNEITARELGEGAAGFDKPAPPPADTGAKIFNEPGDRAGDEGSDGEPKPEQPNRPDECHALRGANKGLVSKQKKRDQNAAAPACSTFLELWGVHAPAHWPRVVKLGKTREGLLRRFAEDFGAESEQIFVDGLRYAQQDGWCRGVRLTLENYLSNGKPLQWAERWRGMSVGGEVVSERVKMAIDGKIGLFDL